MKQILENLDLSEEIKTELTESFDAAVLAEATKLVESKEAEYEEYVSTQLEESRADLETKLDEYLTRVVEEFVSENEMAIEESVNGEKFETLLEGINSVLVAAGVEIAQIAEAKEEADIELAEAKAVEDKELAESEKVDALMEEVMELKATNAELLKTGLVKESMENMTHVQKEKFMKLAAVVEFDATAPESFITKLDTIAESVVGTKTETKEVVEAVEVKEEIVENVASWKKASHLY
jgi:hypothetical protein